MIEALDFTSAVKKAGDAGKANEFGDYITKGLADGVTENAGNLEPSAVAVKNTFLNAIRSAFDMHSPSRLMMIEGKNIPSGLAAGIVAGIPTAVSAMTALGGALQAEAAKQAAAIRAILATGFSVSGASGGGKTGTSATVNYNFGGVNLPTNGDVTAFARELASESTRYMRGIGGRSK